MIGAAATLGGVTRMTGERQRWWCSLTFCLSQFCLIAWCRLKVIYTVESPNNGQVGDKHFVYCSEVVPRLKCMDNNIGRG